MFSDLRDEDGLISEEWEDVDKKGFIGIAIKDISEMPISKLKNIGLDFEMKEWERAYEVISDVLEDYDYVEYEDDEDDY